MRIIDVHLDRAEEGLHFFSSLRLAINVVFRLRVLNRTSDNNSVQVGIAWRRLCFVSIVKFDGDCGLSDSRVALLVDKLLQLFSTHVSQLGNSQNEANGIQNVRFSTAVKASDSIEFLIEGYKI